VLQRLDKDGLNLNIYYVSSAELFDRLPAKRQEEIFPESQRREAMGITGFTLPTLYRFVTSDRGRRATLHPFMKGHYMGSGQAEKVLEEAGLDGESQYRAVKEYIAK
jgi:transketolase